MVAADALGSSRLGVVVIAATAVPYRAVVVDWLLIGVFARA